MDENNKLPVLFLIFKRKEEALKAFEPIRKYQPERLYIAADGPRDSVAGEKEDCEATRKAILDAVDWKCKVKTLFREKNLGCTDAVYGGISWLFENEEYGIVNEDDVVLAVDFFKFCEVLLPKYKDESKVLLISSRNHTGKNKVSDEYIFTYSSNIWGWATWKRAWKLNNNTFVGWKEFNKYKLIRRFGLLRGLDIIRYYNRCSNPNNNFGSWDYTWGCTVKMNDGICICPGVNLSTNVGIGVSDGTNYQQGDEDPYAQLGMGSVKWPLKMQSKIYVKPSQMREEKKDFLRIKKIGLKKKLRLLFKKI